MKNGRKVKIPAFAIAMHERDENLIKKVRDFLGLKNRVYNYKSSESDGSKRGRKAILIVRDYNQLKEIIVPLCYRKFNGFKGRQFEEWMEEISSDPDVSQRFKFIHQLYKNGFYDREIRFLKYNL